MLIDSRHEIYVFAAAFVCGQIICIIFDVFRAVRKNISPSVHTVNIQDIFLGIIILFIVYRTLSYINDAIVRWYEIASLLIACSVYFLFESRWVLKIFTVFFSWFIKPLLIMKSKLYFFSGMLKIRFFKPVFKGFVVFSRNCIKKIRKPIKNHN